MSQKLPKQKSKEKRLMGKKNRMFQICYIHNGEERCGTNIETIMTEKFPPINVRHQTTNQEDQRTPNMINSKNKNKNKTKQKLRQTKNKKHYIPSILYSSCRKSKIKKKPWEESKGKNILSREEQR